MNVVDIMVRDVACVGPDTSVREAASLMLERRISGVPVIDGERRVLGVVSEGDLIRRPEMGTYRHRKGWLRVFLSEDESARDFIRTHGLTAREVMSKPAICVSPDTPLVEVVQLMERKRVKRLVVVESGKLAGILTRRDLLRALLASQSATLPASSDTELRRRIDSMLLEEDWAAGAVVNVQVDNGLVQLWGTVESPPQREALIVAVRGVPGVKEVQTHLGRVLPG